MTLDITEQYEEPVDILGPDGELLLTTNSYLTFNNIRAQIMHDALTGYSIRFKGQRIPIDNEGKLAQWPSELFAKNARLMNYLWKI